mmetsp:Transcript_17784/g.59578  ORF Transcript_17784/g.59578 Transcript_17784/m.59578 type:complete len:232 (-) Transcript_17784:48-743(-)
MVADWPLSSCARRMSVSVTCRSCVRLLGRTERWSPSSSCTVYRSRSGSKAATAPRLPFWCAADLSPLRTTRAPLGSSLGPGLRARPAPGPPLGMPPMPAPLNAPGKPPGKAPKPPGPPAPWKNICGPPGIPPGTPPNWNGPPRAPPPINMSNGSWPPKKVLNICSACAWLKPPPGWPQPLALRPSLPKRSYAARLSALDRQSYASATFLKLSSALASPGFLSGCHLMAARL